MTDSGTTDTYQSVAEEYRNRHADRSVVDTLVDRFLTAVATSIDDRSGRIVDVGCGPGWESATYAARGHEVLGVDLTPAFVRAARDEAPDASFARMDMRRLGLDTGAFDGLWACASFHHVPRKEAPATLSEFHRVLQPGGVLHVSVRHGEDEVQGASYDDDRRRFTLYQPDDLRSMATEAGFTAESVRVEEGWVQLLARA